MKHLYCKTPQEWRKWLKKNHDQESLVWLVFFKKDSGKPSLQYQEALDEALCYGWIDSILKKLDEDSYVRKFTPRKPHSNWSATNKKRVQELIDAKKMTRWGLAKIEAARENGMWEKEDRPQINLDLPEELNAAFAKEPNARDYFETLAPSHKKQYIAWIATAKRPETRVNRVQKAIKMLNTKQKPGLF